MATKTKTSETPAPVPSPSVEATFSEGLEQLNAGNLEAAAESFKAVREQAAAAELLNLGRAARGYLAAIEARLQERGEASRETPELAAQVLLNQRESAAALAGLDKALANAPERAPLHYLKALAHAQLDQAQEAADALAKAVKGDADFLYQFRLEPDFDGIRHSAPIAALLRG
jgi:tetratricopeptide (TPR) repeat protein